MARSGRTALITGSGRNIGRACALALARDGFNVVVNGSSNQANCDAVAEEVRAIGTDALVVMGDVGTIEGAEAVAAAALGEFARIDVLINNAAIRPSKPFLETDEAMWEKVLGIDFHAARRLAKACLPGMIEAGWGRIVNFAGMHAIHGYAGRPTVSVSKHAAWGLTKAMAMEFGPHGITTNIISPGPIRPDDDADAAKKMADAEMDHIPVGRLGEPDEVAAVVAMLVSDKGAFVNGQLLQVNGGAET